MLDFFICSRERTRLVTRAMGTCSLAPALVLATTGGDGGAAALGEEDAVYAGSVRGAQEGAEVVGVFDAVEGEEEAAVEAARAALRRSSTARKLALADGWRRRPGGRRCGRCG